MKADDPRHGSLVGYKAHLAADSPPCFLCRRANADYERQRGYDQHLGRPRLVPSRGVQRRVQALMCLGWSIPMIIAECGWRGRKALQYPLTNDSCNRRTAERVAAVYERLSMRTPPLTQATSKARNYAARMGYLPPLAWDDIDRDPEPPAALYSGPEIDPVVVMRLLEGDRNVTSNAAEKDEAMRQWRADGGSEREFCAVHGWKTGRYGRLRVVEEAS